MTKEILVLGGPNGAGKTTLAREYLSRHDVPFLNADEIQKDLDKAFKGDTRLTAGRQFLEALDLQVRAGKSFAIESTLSGRTLLGVLRGASNVGFDIRIWFVHVDSPQTCIDRIKQRVSKGGHHVPDDDVLRRYERSRRNFWRLYRHEADRWRLVDNSKGLYMDVAAGRAQRYTVMHSVLFEAFLQGIGE